MQTTPIKQRQEQGSVLMTVVIIGGIISIVTAAMLFSSSSSLQNAHGRVDWNKAFYCSENAVVWAAQAILDNPPATGSYNYYSTAAGTLPLASIIAPVNGDTDFKGAWVKIVQPKNALSDFFVITASSRVNNKVHTVQATVTAYPVSQVFDYEYFLNNWGWWWGSTISGNGSQRANWDFDFKGGPQVNGNIYAANYIEENGVPYNQYTQSAPFGGLAGADPLDYVHPGAPRVTMPNLLSFSNYTAVAMSDTANNGIWVGTNQVVAGALKNQTGSSDHGGNAGNSTPQTGVYLVGTPSNPIIIKGTAVVPGDVVIKGTVTGKGTIYVGGNLYIANNVTYAHGPDFSSPPETMTPAQRDAWVAQNMNNDLVAYAVRGSILTGDVTNPDWINWCYSYPGSGLASVGDESHLGADGIAGTPDDNTPFLHPDGTMSTWYDADGDGKINSNYNYATDINMDNNRVSYLLGYPTDNKGQPLPYNQVATDNMGTLEGIFYTDHAAAMRLEQSTAIFHGVIISRNEQIIFQNNLSLNYDSRVHSRYHNNPNQFINLGLPYGKPLQVNSFAELPPDSTNL
jgi:hypothetical protein